MTPPLDPATLVGLPYRALGRVLSGPGRGVDCWGLVLALRPDVPDYGVDPDRARDLVRAFAEGARDARWVRLEDPRDLCIVGMGARGGLSHAGIWWRRRVIHAASRLGGVRADYASDLPTLGYAEPSYWDWRP